VDYRFKPHVPPFVQIPAYSVKFQLVDNVVLAQVEYLRVSLNFYQKFNTHLLRHELPGAQPLFDTHAFMHQRQISLKCYLQSWDVQVLSFAFYRWYTAATFLKISQVEGLA